MPDKPATIAEYRLHETDTGSPEVQIALLTDRKTAKIIALLEELRQDSPAVRDRHDPEAAALSKATDPHAVTAELEKRTPSVHDARTGA